MGIKGRGVVRGGKEKWDQPKRKRNNIVMRVIKNNRLKNIVSSKGETALKSRGDGRGKEATSVLWTSEKPRKTRRVLPW